MNTLRKSLAFQPGLLWFTEQAKNMCWHCGDEEQAEVSSQELGVLLELNFHEKWSL